MAGLLLVAGAGPTPGAAQPDSPTRAAEAPFFSGERGVVWTVPPSARAARLTLEQMATGGVTAVRVPDGPWLDDETASSVLDHAASLGIAVAVDLPLRPGGAAQLRAAADTLGPALDRLAALAKRYPSLVAVGLGAHHDTTVPTTCEAMATLSDAVTQRMDVATYYLTPFRPAADQCAGAVTGVLADLRGLGDPVARWAAWTETSGPVAVGAVGTWVDPSAGRGLQAPHSPERQARLLESVLTQWIPKHESPERAPEVDRREMQAVAAGISPSSVAPTVFVARWKDVDSPMGRRYGLHTASGEPRPAADVVRGIYRGEQRVFAFPSGTEPGPEAPWAVLFGWGILIGLAVLYAQRPLFRRALTRYFTAHGFYRDSVREGRDTVPLVNWLWLIVIAIATGIVVAVVGAAAAPTVAVEHAVEALGGGAGETLGYLVARPVITGTLAGGGVLVLLLLWSLVIGLSVRQWMALRSDQVLMLVGWPCWPALLWMGVALVTASGTGGQGLQAAGLLAMAALASTVWATVRVLWDVWAVTRMPAAAVVLLALLSPLVLALGGVVLFGLQADLPVSLLIHLFTRT
jgi:hypothetical protein